MNNLKTASNIPQIKLIYRNTVEPSRRPQVKSDRDAYHILREDWDNDTINLVEEFKLMTLDRNLRVMSVSTISKGGMSGTVADLKVIFATALLSRAHRIIVAHNHPSGSTKPSEQDIKTTKKIKDAGELLDMPLDDHIILTDTGYLSMSGDGFI